jgi:hypothetical protein
MDDDGSIPQNTVTTLSRVLVNLPVLRVRFHFIVLIVI